MDDIMRKGYWYFSVDIVPVSHQLSSRLSTMNIIPPVPHMFLKN